MHCNTGAIIDRNGQSGPEILVQVRNKPQESGKSIELPGGRFEEFESLVGALRREVREETGLELSFIEGLETRIETNGADTNMECIKPFAVYQTLRGPVDSMGVYFRCHAEGRLLEVGDDTERPHWIAVSEIKRLMSDDPERFSFVDRAGLVFLSGTNINMRIFGHDVVKDAAKVKQMIGVVPSGILLGMAVLFFAIGAWRFKYE